MPSVPMAQQLVGSRFGRLLVVEAVRVNNVLMCRSVCDCGVEKLVSPSNLTRPSGTVSCGCHRRSLFTKHGMSTSAEYRSWDHMIQRCSNPKNQRFADYGGRGVLVCDRWLESFENFLSDMGFKPTPKHTLDRVDNNKGYSPENCRWADPKTQMNNKKNNHYLEFNGETKSLSDWSLHTGIPYSCLSSRIARGWSVERALTEQVAKYNKSQEKNDARY